MNNEKTLRLIPNYRFTDEYERQVLLNLYAKLYVLLFWGTLMISALDCFISMYFQHIPFVSILALIGLMVASTLISRALHNKKVDLFDVDSKAEYQKYIKKARNGSILFAFVMFITFNINNYLIPFVMHQELPKITVLSAQLPTTAIIAMITGLIIYMIAKSKIIRTYKK